MVKTCVIGFILFVGTGLVSANPHNVGPHISSFDLVKKAAHTQMIDDLGEIFENYNQTGLNGSAVDIVKRVGGAFITKYSVDDRTKDMITMVEQETITMLNSLNTIFKMLIEIPGELNIEFNENIFMQKYEAMDNVLLDMILYYGKFTTHLMTYSKVEDLAPRIRQMADDLRKNELDLKMVKLAIDKEAGEPDSFIYSYVKYLQFNSAGIKASANQQIMQFYEHILMHAQRVNVLLELSYQLLMELENSDVSKDLEYVENRFVEVKQNVTVGAKKVFNLFNQIDYQNVHVDELEESAVEDSNFFHLNRVWYTFFTTNKELSAQSGRGEHCKKSCFDYRNVDFTSPYCNGSVLNCKYTMDSLNVGVDLKIINDENRLYSGYKLGKMWFGSADGPGDLVQVRSTTMDRHRCMACMCTCNNYRSVNSHRYFYNQEIYAPDGYVVTGVRFAKKFYKDIQKTVIFVQPEIAELIDIARVNSSTVRWMDLPSHLNEKDLYRLHGPDRDIMILGDLAFDRKAYITGLKINDVTKTQFQRKTLQIIGREVQINNGKIQLGNRVEGQFNSNQRAYLLTKTDESIDAGQRITPVFENRSFNLTTPMPLVGINLKSYSIVTPHIKLDLIYPQLRTESYADVL